MITQTCKELLEWPEAWHEVNPTKNFQKSVLGGYGKALCTVINYL